MITVHSMGLLQKKFTSSLWHWLTLSFDICPVKCSLVRQPLLTSLHFHILKKKTVLLGEFSFPTRLLKVEHTNKDKVGRSMWGGHMGPQGCHLPGDLRMERNYYICKLFLTCFKQIIHAHGEKYKGYTNIWWKTTFHLSPVCQSHNASPKNQLLLLIS